MRDGNLDSVEPGGHSAPSGHSGGGTGRPLAWRRIAIEGFVGVAGIAVFSWLATSFVRGGLVVGFDDDTARWVAQHLPTFVEWAARPLSWLGGLVGSVLVTGFAAFLLWRAGRRSDAAFVVAAVVGITLLVAVLKRVYERARPDFGSAVDLPHSYSFPSGHAATAVVLYGAIAVLAAERAPSRRRAYGWLLGGALLAVAIGASRIALGVHYVSDVMAGLAVGLAWLCGCLIVRDVLAGRTDR